MDSWGELLRGQGHTRPGSGLNTKRVTISLYTHSTCTDLQHHLVEVGPVYKEVVMWSVREDNQHEGYRHW